MNDVAIIKRATSKEVLFPCWWLCVFASGSFMITIFSFSTVIKFSCLHLGQYSGKFLINVSCLILIRVLLLQLGQNIQLLLLVLSITIPPHNLITHSLRISTSLDDYFLFEYLLIHVLHCRTHKNQYNLPAYN